MRRKDVFSRVGSLRERKDNKASEKNKMFLHVRFWMGRFDFEFCQVCLVLSRNLGQKGAGLSPCDRQDFWVLLFDYLAFMLCVVFSLFFFPLSDSHSQKTASIVFL